MVVNLRLLVVLPRRHVLHADDGARHARLCTRGRHQLLLQTRLRTVHSPTRHDGSKQGVASRHDAPSDIAPVGCYEWACTVGDGGAAAKMGGHEKKKKRGLAGQRQASRGRQARWIWLLFQGHG